MFKIGICGSHGTGKSTLAKIITQEFGIKPIQKTMRNMWESYGVSDFEKLPVEVRKTFQYYAILNQIEKEEDAKSGFVTDRTVLDNLVYTILSSEINNLEKQIYEALVKERLKNYTHLIYVPVEFVAEPEHLRANPKSQQKTAEIFENYLKTFFPQENYLRVKGSVEERLEQIKVFIGKT